MSRIPDSSDEGVVMFISRKESSSGSRSSVGIDDDARAGGRYLVVPDGTSTTIDLEDPPHSEICEVNIGVVITMGGGGGAFQVISKTRTMISFSTMTLMRVNVRL